MLDTFTSAAQPRLATAVDSAAPSGAAVAGIEFGTVWQRCLSLAELMTDLLTGTGRTLAAAVQDALAIRAALTGEPSPQLTLAQAGAERAAGRAAQTANGYAGGTGNPALYAVAAAGTGNLNNAFWYADRAVRGRADLIERLLPLRLRHREHLSVAQAALPLGQHSYSTTLKLLQAYERDRTRPVPAWLRHHLPHLTRQLPVRMLTVKTFLELARIDLSEEQEEVFTALLHDRAALNDCLTAARYALNEPS